MSRARLYLVCALALVTLWQLALLSNATPNAKQQRAWTVACQARTGNNCEVTP